ncbi:hypothetical protein LINPERHAP2_LOCUS27406 [Linum perenne]
MTVIESSNRFAPVDFCLVVSIEDLLHFIFLDVEELVWIKSVLEVARSNRWVLPLKCLFSGRRSKVQLRCFRKDGKRFLHVAELCQNGRHFFVNVPNDDNDEGWPSLLRILTKLAVDVVPPPPPKSGSLSFVEAVLGPRFNGNGRWIMLDNSSIQIENEGVGERLKYLERWTAEAGRTTVLKKLGIRWLIVRGGVPSSITLRFNEEVFKIWVVEVDVGVCAFEVSDLSSFGETQEEKAVRNSGKVGWKVLLLRGKAKTWEFGESSRKERILQPSLVELGESRVVRCMDWPPAGVSTTIGKEADKEVLKESLSMSSFGTSMDGVQSLSEKEEMARVHQKSERKDENLQILDVVAKVAQVLDVKLADDSGSAMDVVLKSAEAVLDRRRKSGGKSRTERELAKLGSSGGAVSGVSIRGIEIEEVDDIIIQSVAFCLRFQWTTKMAVGSAGGIITLWNSDLFLLEAQWVGKFCVVNVFRNVEDSFCWLLINVYGPCEWGDKPRCVEELKEVLDWWSYPACIVGDFNMVRRNEEVRGLRRDPRELELFNDFVDDAGLLELPLVGAEFTWSNLRSFPSLSRLDRAFISAN